jgi:hypothetical protein
MAVRKFMTFFCDTFVSRYQTTVYVIYFCLGIKTASVAFVFDMFQKRFADGFTIE